VQERLEAWVREDPDAAFCRGDEDCLAAPAEGDLVGLYGLLVGCQRCGLRGRQDEDIIRLFHLSVERNAPFTLLGACNACMLLFSLH
jgi:hypothetical protein